MAAIAALRAAGRTVLLTAYTHSAVDNVARKLAAAGIGFVRMPGSSPRQVRVPGAAAWCLCVQVRVGGRNRARVCERVCGVYV